MKFPSHLLPLVAASPLIIGGCCKTPCDTSYVQSSPVSEIIEQPSQGDLAILKQAFAGKLIRGGLAELEDQYKQALGLGRPVPSVFLREGNTKGALPILPHYPLPLKHLSYYDGSQSSFIIRAPANPKEAKALIIVLGDSEAHRELLPKTSAHWILAMPPTRGPLGYQLLGEGDFWQRLKLAKHYYPELKALPTYLLAVGSAAEDALRLANDYRGRFSGIAFSGNLEHPRFPNLDQFPVVHFESRWETEPHLWPGQELVQRLEKRGNALAVNTHYNATRCVELLIAMHEKSPLWAPFSFTDFQHAHVWPWLRVAGRTISDKAISIAAHREGDSLVIEGDNIAGLQLRKTEDLAKDIQAVRFKGQTYPLLVDETTTIGHCSPQSKAMHAGGLANFFRNEPLLVVYQDSAPSVDYRVQMQELAHDLSTMNFTGIPAVEVKLPVLSLEEYERRRWPAHRAIFIGQASLLNPPSPHQQVGTFLLCHPSNHHDNLRLGYWVCAEDIEGLKKVSEHLKLATCLYQPQDWRSWEKCGSQYQLAQAQIFDDNWEQKKVSRGALSIPIQSPETWNCYLRDLLITESQTGNHALPSLINGFQDSPRTLAYQQVKEFVPDREFAEITIRGSSMAETLSKILKQFPVASLEGIGDLLKEDSLEVDPKKLRRKKRQLIIDAQALRCLSEEERKRVDPHLLPYSMGELLQRQLAESEEEVGRSLLRIANPSGEG